MARCEVTYQCPNIACDKGLVDEGKQTIPPVSMECEWCDGKGVVTATKYAELMTMTQDCSDIVGKEGPKRYELDRLKKVLDCGGYDISGLDNEEMKELCAEGIHIIVSKKEMEDAIAEIEKLLNEYEECAVDSAAIILGQAERVRELEMEVIKARNGILDD